MSARRPRVKAIANIGVKRKIKEEIVEKPEVEVKPNEETSRSNKIIKVEAKVETLSVTTAGNVPPIPTATPEESAKDTPLIDNSDENIKSSILDSQQVRPRQRIKATPCFDVRRNSIHGPNEEQPMENLGQMKEPKLPPPSAQNLFNSNRSPIANRTRTESVSSTTTQQNANTIASTSTISIPDHNHQYFHSNYPPSREHIPPRHRKISTMEDAQRLTAARKEFNTKYSRKTPEKSVLKMFEFIYYNPSSNPMKFDEKCTASSNKLNEIASTKSETDINLEQNEVDDPEEMNSTEPNNDLDAATSALPVPQLKLGPNGEIILDEKSLLIETTDEKKIRSNLAASKNLIYLDEYSGNNGFYSRQKRTKDWSADETIKFYRCLHTVGTDFSLMLAFFPNRSRRDLKLKFKKEEKFNEHLINKAMLCPKAYNIEELNREFEREKELIEEKRKQWKEMEEQQQQQNNIIYDDVNNDDTNDDGNILPNSKASRVLTKGNLAYKNENVTRPLKRRKKREPNIKKSKKTVEKDTKNEIIKIENNEEENIINNNEIINDLKSPEHKINDSLNDEILSETVCGGGSVEITDIGEIFSFGDILPQLKGTSLALVSSIDDSQNIEKITHEIYIVCKNTGNLSNKPLDLPKDTIDCILMAMEKI